MLLFEWGNHKNEVNVLKHKISFSEASEAFYDEAGILIYDPDHSLNEDRFVLLGLAKSKKLVVVCHCYRSDDKIRLISARKATKQETKCYYERK